MYKIVIFLTLFTHLLFSATSDQIDKYMSLIHADRDLIEVEKIFSNIGDSVETSDENTSEEITLSYQIYLGKHLSENELDELLTLYRKPVMQQYITEMDTVEIPEGEMQEFLLSLKENPLPTERLDIIDELIATIINEDLMLDFYQSMVKLYNKDIVEGNSTKKQESNSSKKAPTAEEKKFLEVIKEGVKQELFYGTQVLSMEELRQVNEIMKSSVITKATKVETEALIEITNIFINRIVSKPKEEKK
jgi:hypothetical protein